MVLALKKLFNTAAVSFCCLLSPFALADAAKNEGFRIAKEVQDRDSGWGNSHATMEMILTNKHGVSSKREMEQKTLEVQNDGDKSLTIFHEPRDVKGTAFLSFSHALKPDQQWLFLPALKRTKRISSANKSGPFLGSEFAFEDLSSFEIEKYDYEYLRDDVVAKAPVYIVKYLPQYKHSGYQYLEIAIDKKEYIMHKIDFYDRKGSHLKTLRFNKYQHFNDRYWRAMEFIVNNHQTGKKTVLNWKNYQFDTGLKEADFNQAALKRAR